MEDRRNQDKRRRLLYSMVVLAGIVLVAGFATITVTDYLKSVDPIYQCINDPVNMPYQQSISIAIMRDNSQVTVPANVGINEGCTRPVHTLEENVIHVAYNEPFTFTLGHFLYNFNVDITKYDAKVYIDGVLHDQGSYLDIPLQDGQQITIEFTTR